MKLLFDQNLSYKLVRLIEDLFPESSRVRLLGFAQRPHRQQGRGHVELTIVRGTPPKVV